MTHPFPITSATARRMFDAVNDMADALADLDHDPTWGAGMTCNEVDCIASVLKIAGRGDVAADLVMRHSSGDGDSSSGDRHHEVAASYNTQSTIGPNEWHTIPAYHLALAYVAAEL